MNKKLIFFINYHCLTKLNYKNQSNSINFYENSKKKCNNKTNSII